MQTPNIADDPGFTVRAAVRVARGRLNEEPGFSLIEVLASVLIVVLIAAVVADGLIAGTHLSSYQRHQSQANQVAQQDQERLRGLSAKQLGDLSPAQSRTVLLDGTTYTVTSTATLVGNGGTSSCLSTGTGAVAYFHTGSNVTWIDTGAPKAVQEESVIAPPLGGTLLAQVRDQTDVGLSGVNVAATGPDVNSANTDSGGCAYLTGLAAGNYSVAVTDPGYVDPDGNASVSTSATVSATGTALPASNPIVLGQAGMITANFSATGVSGPLSNQEAPSLSWYGTGTSSLMSNSLTISSPTPATVLKASNLFPFWDSTASSYTSNYQLWAGKCVQEQPPADTDAATVSPGSTQALVVSEPALTALVSYAGVPVIPTHMKMTFTGGSGSGTCTESWSPNVSATAATSADGALASPGQPFATSVTTGPTASASGQTGQLTVCADYNTGASYRKFSTNTDNANFTAPTTVNVPIQLSSASGLC